MKLKKKGKKSSVWFWFVCGSLNKFCIYYLKVECISNHLISVNFFYYKLIPELVRRGRGYFLFLFFISRLYTFLIRNTVIFPECGQLLNTKNQTSFPQESGKLFIKHACSDFEARKIKCCLFAYVPRLGNGRILILRNIFE